MLLAISAGFALAGAPAAAQTNSVMAESLFQEGRKLLREKKFDLACPKFVESARLDMSSGVELALGLCYEGQGKTASAWGAYVLAASLARRDNRADREKAANEHVSLLEPRLSRVTIEVAPETAKLAGVELREDGIVLGSEAWKDAPIDPGEHMLAVTAPGKRPYKESFTVEARSPRTKVAVPGLEDEPAPPTTTLNPPVTPTQTSGHPGQAGAKRQPGSAGRGGHAAQTEETSALRPVGYVLGASGLLSVGVGSVLGLLAINKANSVNKICSPPTCSDAQAVTANGTAGTLADWSTGTLIGGGVGVLLGAILVLAAPQGATDKDVPPAGRSARWHPLVGPGAIGAGCEW